MTTDTTTPANNEALDMATITESYMTVMDYMSQGGTLKDLQGLTQENMEAIYAVAFNLYSAAKYEQAHSLFQYLCMLLPYEKKYWLGLGACRQMRKEYQSAVDAYCLACALDPSDPNAPLHAGECLLSLGNAEGADKSFEMAVEFAGKDPAYTRAKDRAQSLRSLIQKNK